MENNFGFIGIEAVIFGKGPTFKKVEKKKIKYTFVLTKQ